MKEQTVYYRIVPKKALHKSPLSQGSTQYGSDRLLQFKYCPCCDKTKLTGYFLNTSGIVSDICMDCGNHWYKQKVNKKLQGAVKRGKLKKCPCLFCGCNKNSHGHHWDYNKPYDVDWLCSDHHKEVHSMIRSVAYYATPKDIFVFQLWRNTLQSEVKIYE